VSPLRTETVADMWAHARELTRTAGEEGNPAAARRALVVLAIAGSGGAREDFSAAARDVLTAFARIGLDPIPVFDAASALADDAVAREVLLMLPREAAATVRDELTSRITRG
jgi:hypothetical protein